MTKRSNYLPLIALGTLFLLGALLKPVAAAKQEAAMVEVADQYGAAAVTLYFMEQEEDYLIPVSRRVGDEAEQVPMRALEELLAGPESGLLIPSFGEGTEILDFAVNGAEATIALAMPGDVAQLSAQTVDALRWTMTEFDEIERIVLTVNGWAVDANGGFVESAISLSRPESINSHVSAAGQPVLLYFGYAPDPSLLIPMTAFIDADDGNGQITEAVAQLLAGPPTGSNLISTVPDNVELLDAALDGVIANVNFSEDLVIAYRLKEANALHVRKAVIATLTSIPDVFAGSIEIGGSSLLYFSCQNVVMEHPLAKPWAINDEFYM